MMARAQWWLLLKFYKAYAWFCLWEYIRTSFFSHAKGVSVSLGVIVVFVQRVAGKPVEMTDVSQEESLILHSRPPGYLSGRGAFSSVQLAGTFQSLDQRPIVGGNTY